MFKLSRVGDTEQPRRVCILGIGGGGCRAVGAVEAGSGGPAVVAVNTDDRSLEESGVLTKIRLGRTNSDADGTGGDAEQGRMLAEHDIEMIRGLFTAADVAVIVTCLGGGTGSGATPVVVKAARDAGVFTIVLATSPFEFEGDNRKKVAEAGMRALASAADLVCVIDNTRLFAAVGGDNHAEVFKRADRRLAEGLEGLWQVLVQPAFMGIDLADLRGLAAKSGGICLFGFGDGHGVTRGMSAVKELRDGPVFEEGKALRSAGAAVVCVAGSQDMTLVEVGDVMAEIAKDTPSDCNLIMGSVVNAEWVDRLLVLVFVTDRKRVVRSKPVADTERSVPVKGRRNKDRERQNKLKLDMRGKGRFKGVEATILDGQDLDVPTYIRLGIKLDD